MSIAMPKFLRRSLLLTLLCLSIQIPAHATPGNLIADPDSFVDSEFLRSGALELIRAQYAYARGYTGKSVVVAVIDSGLYAEHPEFRGRVVGGWNFLPDQEPWDFSDTELSDEEPFYIDGHGTHVSGIIAAARDGVQMHGVAPEAQLLGIRADTDRDWTAFDYAIRMGAKVINGSYGPDAAPERYIPDPADPDGGYIENPSFPADPYAESIRYQFIDPSELQMQADMLRRAAAADIVIVFAAGNDYGTHPAQASHVSGYGMYHLITPEYFQSQPPGVDPMFRFVDVSTVTDPYDPSTYGLIPFDDERVNTLDFSDLGGSILSVVAVDNDGVIASYSNRCGHAALWCLAAPGGDGDPDTHIYSTHPDPRTGYYVPMDGTSMAAPVVAGAAAVVREAFPYMDARQIIEVILTTTNDQGLYNQEAIYGRGLLDLGKAVRGPGEFGADGFADMFVADTKGVDSHFSNDIRGDGGLIKAGAGTLTLSGKNGYGGPTIITGGQLVVNGYNATSNFTVEPEGTLGGSGAVGSTEVYGRIAPGNSIGTITIMGNYTQHPGSVLEIEVDGSGASDQLDIWGDADLQGGEVQLIGLTGGVVGREYTFMNVTGAIAGPGFDRVRDDYLFVGLRLVPTSSGFRLAINRSATFASLARTKNQGSAAQAIDALGAGTIPYETLIVLQNADRAPKLYDQFSGELHATARSMVLADTGMVRRGLMSRLTELTSHTGVSYREGLSRTGAGTGVWGHLMASWGRFDGAGIAHDARRHSSGFLLGLDHEWSPGVTTGLAAGYTRSRIRAELDNKATLDGYHLLAYGTISNGPWRLRGGIGHSWHSIDTQRHISVAGPGHQTADYNIRTTQVFTEAGYALPAGSATIEPYAGISHTWQRAKSFEEDGTSPLSGRSGSDNFTQSNLGVRGHWQLDTKVGDLQLTSGAAWLHTYGSLSPRAKLSHANGTHYSLSGVPHARNALQLELKANLAHSQRASLELGYQATIGGGVKDHGLRLQASYRF